MNAQSGNAGRMSGKISYVSTSQRSETPAWWRTEDWLAVFTGLLMLVAVLAGWRPAMPAFKWTAAADLASVVATSQLTALAILGGVLLVLSTLAMALMRAALGKFVTGFLVVFLLAWLAQVMAGQTKVQAWGLEYVIFGLVIGLLINHAVGVPAWLREAVRTEFYIKTGLVILGATSLLQELLQAGALGLAQDA